MGVALISEISLSGKENEHPLQVQPKNPVTSFEAICSSPLLGGLAIKLRREPLSNHISNQKDSLLSLPTTHFAPFLKIGSPFRIADQIVEQDLNDRA